MLSYALVKTGFYSKNQKMCFPILVTLLKMRPHYSQSSRENATPLASHKELGLWNSEHMQLKESGPAPLYPETKNTRSTENDWNPK